MRVEEARAGYREVLIAFRGITNQILGLGWIVSGHTVGL